MVVKKAPCIFPQPLRRDSCSHSCFNRGVVAERRKRRRLSFTMRNCGSLVIRPLRTSCRIVLLLLGFSRPSSANCDSTNFCSFEHSRQIRR